MASKISSFFLAVAFSSVFFGAANAQTGSCTSSLLALYPCLSFIQGTAAAPDASCCSGLASVVKTSPLCLCQLLKGGSSQLGIPVNRTLALQLPSLCGVQTPPSSACDVASAPPATPIATPSTNSSSPGVSSEGSQSPPTEVFKNGSSVLSPLSSFLVFLYVTFVMGVMTI